LIPDNNGPPVFTQLEINNNAVPVGLSEVQKLSQTDSVLPQADLLTLFYPLKIAYHVITQTWDAMVDG
jgi:hypothetical protein